MTLITACGCCQAAQCGSCNPAESLPYELKVDIGGPYGFPQPCHYGGPVATRCNFTIGGVYTLQHLAFGVSGICPWGYDEVVCSPDGEPFGRLMIKFDLGQGDLPLQVGSIAMINFQVNYRGNVSQSPNYTDRDSPVGIHGTRHPAPNCLAALQAGLILRVLTAPSLPFCTGTNPDGSSAPSPPPPQTLVVYI